MRCEKRFFSQKKRNEHDARHFKQGFSQVETCNVLYIIEKRNSVVHFFSGNSNVLYMMHILRVKTYFFYAKNTKLLFEERSEKREKYRMKFIQPKELNRNFIYFKQNPKHE